MKATIFAGTPTISTSVSVTPIRVSAMSEKLPSIYDLVKKLYDRLNGMIIFCHDHKK